jgi:hypothetical protein
LPAASTASPLSHRLPARDVLQTATTATALSAGGVGWDWGNILDASNAHARTGKGAKGGLGTWAWGLGAVTTSGTKLDVQGVDPDFFAADDNVLGGKHSSVWRGFVTVSFDLHSTGNTYDGFAPGDISNVHKGVVKGCKDVRNTKYKGAFRDLRAKS